MIKVADGGDTDIGSDSSDSSSEESSESSDDDDSDDWITKIYFTFTYKIYDEYTCSNTFYILHVHTALTCLAWYESRGTKVATFLLFKILFDGSWGKVSGNPDILTSLVATKVALLRIHLGIYYTSFLGLSYNHIQIIVSVLGFDFCHFSLLWLGMIYGLFYALHDTF